MSLNFYWIQRYQPSKLNDKKNVRFTTKTDMIFFEPVGVQRHTVPHFKGVIKLDWNQERPRA